MKQIATPFETQETPIGNSALQAELEATKQIASDRQKTIDDLRDRLDREAEERRQITTRLLEYEKPKGFWARMTGR